MAQMYKKVKLARTERGEFCRNLGKFRGEDGRVRVPKFRAGFDERKAVVNLSRVERLWDRIVEKTPADEAALWDAICLQVAHAISKDRLEFRLPRALVEFGEEDTYVHFVSRYADLCEGIIRVLPEDDAAYSAGLGIMQAERDEAIRTRIDPGFPRVEAFPAPVIPVGRPHETLHKAIDAMVAELDEKAGGDRSGWAGTQIRQLLTLKANHEDAALGSIDPSAIRKMAEYWMARPKRQGSDEPVAAVTARRQWERFVALLHWVHRSQEYAWRMPADALDGIVFRAKKTPADHAARVAALRQKSWTAAQLALIYKHATPLVRALVTLGLNCGYYGVDVATQIDSDEVIFLGQTHPHADYLLNGEPADLQEYWRRPLDWMIVLRNKTGVPGEWLLWPHTAAAIRWARGRKRRLGIDTDLLFPTEKGTAFNDPTEGGNRHDKLAKKWKAAWEMACREDTSLPWRPLSSLRDTVSDLVARHDDTASTLLVRHGQPFRGDSLLELYAGRPFLRVHKQLERIQGVFAPLWEAVPEPFPEADE